MNALDVETFIVGPQDSLCGQSAVEWLSSGGAPDPVIALAEDCSSA